MSNAQVRFHVKFVSFSRLDPWYIETIHIVPSNKPQRYDKYSGPTWNHLKWNENIYYNDTYHLQNAKYHYSDVIMGAMTFQITSLTIGYLTIYSGADQRKHQSSASMAFVRGIRRWPVKSPHKWPVTRKMFPFDDAIMIGSG